MCWNCGKGEEVFIPNTKGVISKAMDKKRVSKEVYVYMREKLSEKLKEKSRLDAEVMVLEFTLENCEPIFSETEKKIAKAMSDAIQNKQKFS